MKSGKPQAPNTRRDAPCSSSLRSQPALQTMPLLLPSIRARGIPEKMPHRHGAKQGGAIAIGRLVLLPHVRRGPIGTLQSFPELVRDRGREAVRRSSSRQRAGYPAGEKPFGRHLQAELERPLVRAWIADIDAPAAKRALILVAEQFSQSRHVRCSGKVRLRRRQAGPRPLDPCAA